MKNPSRIDFKNAQNYPLKYILQLMGSLVNIDKPDEPTNTLNNYLYNNHNQLLNELYLFQSERNYHITNFKRSYKNKYAEYLMDTLPTLCLSKSEKLDDLLEDFGLSEKSKTFFVNKEKIDFKIHEIISSIKIDNQHKAEIEFAIKILSYTIIFLRCLANLSEEIRGFYSEKRKIIHLKVFLEGELRKIRNDKTLHYEELPEKFNNLMNSPFGKFLIKAMNGALSKNHKGSYNVNFLSSLIYSASKEYSEDTYSDDEILFKLGALFRMIYGEKNIKATEEEFYTYNQEDKNPKGDNFRDHVVKKCKSIINYKGSDHTTEVSQNYEPEQDVDFNEFLKIFLGL